MAEKRKFQRVRRRLVIEFTLSGVHCYGFTHDLSTSGMFIRSIRIPTIGLLLNAELQLPDGTRLPIEGKVIRSFRAPGSLSHLVPSGFGMSLSQFPAEYSNYLSGL